MMRLRAMRIRKARAAALARGKSARMLRKAKLLIKATARDAKVSHKITFTHTAAKAKKAAKCTGKCGDGKIHIIQKSILNLKAM
jgi:hypothetical protein